MLLQTFTLTLTPSGSGPGCTADELRSFFAARFSDYAERHNQDAGTFIHRYPVVQCKLIGSVPAVVGINEGARALKEIADEHPEIRIGETMYQIRERGIPLKEEEFGIAGTIQTYEFITPWLALNQENNRKFYTLKGKPARDAFMQKVLGSSLLAMAKALNYDLPVPITCEQQVHFRKEWMKTVSVMVFTGKFRTNLVIPDLLGIGRSVSQGFGVVRRVKE